MRIRMRLIVKCILLRFVHSVHKAIIVTLLYFQEHTFISFIFYDKKSEYSFKLVKKKKYEYT